MAERPVITIDGRLGGGQLLRTSFALGALAQQVVKVTNIRGARNPPGLLPHHLQGIQMIAHLCNGRLEGDTVNSRECTLWPSYFKDGSATIDTKSARSCTLLAQTAMAPLLFCPGPSSFTFKGGTDVADSLPADEMCGCLMRILLKFGVDAQVDVVRRGFHPAGRGEIILSVELPKCNTGLKPVNMIEQGTLIAIKGRSFASGSRELKDMKKVVTAAKELLLELLPTVPIVITEVEESGETAVGNACGLTIVAITDTGCRYAATCFRDERVKIPPEESGRRTVEALAAEVSAGACVDSHTQHQLPIFMAIAGGRSEIRFGEITPETRGLIMACEALLPCHFQIIPDDGTNILQCDGVRLMGPGRFTSPNAAGGSAAAKKSNVPAFLYEPDPEPAQPPPPKKEEPVAEAETNAEDDKGEPAPPEPEPEEEDHTWAGQPLQYVDEAELLKYQEEEEKPEGPPSSVFGELVQTLKRERSPEPPPSEDQSGRPRSSFAGFFRPGESPSGGFPGPPEQSMPPMSMMPPFSPPPSQALPPGFSNPFGPPVSQPPAAPTALSSPFGGSANPFMGNAPPSAPTAANPFGGASFSAPLPSANPFAAPQAPPPSAPTMGNPFAAMQPPPSMPVMSHNPFAAPPPPSAGPFGATLMGSSGPFGNPNAASVFSAPNPFASNPSPPAAPAASGFSFQQAPSSFQSPFQAMPQAATSPFQNLGSSMMGPPNPMMSNPMHFATPMAAPMMNPMGQMPSAPSWQMPMGVPFVGGGGGDGQMQMD